ncbi:MAG: hypothetical protein RL653_2761 [Pseudomonadota bacterium]
MNGPDLHPEELIDRSVAGRLTDDESARLDAHLAACTACRAEMRLRRDFAELPSLDGRLSALVDRALAQAATQQAVTDARETSAHVEPDDARMLDLVERASADLLSRVEQQAPAEAASATQVVPAPVAILELADFTVRKPAPALPTTSAALIPELADFAVVRPAPSLPLAAKKASSADLVALIPELADFMVRKPADVVPLRRDLPAAAAAAASAPELRVVPAEPLDPNDVFALIPELSDFVVQPWYQSPEKELEYLLADFAVAGASEDAVQEEAHAEDEWAHTAHPRARGSEDTAASRRKGSDTLGGATQEYGAPVEKKKKKKKADSAAPVLPAIGAMINHYEVIRLLGKGGMGAVFLARDTKLGRRVAIKFLLTKHPEMTERFILEARNTALFNHENIIIIYEVDQWEGSPFMVFEFLTGQELTKLIPDGKPMPVPRVAELMVPVCRALQYAHAQAIVHRDLKPDNIQVTESGTVKVLDFGIAKAMNKEEDARERASEEGPPPDSSGGNKELTQSGAIMGTIAYMSPEQWGIGVSIDHRADIWAVGIMLFRMLAGEHPLHPLRGEQLMITGILEQPMPKLKSKLPSCPDELANIVDKCLMKVKEERWPDSASLVKALEAFLPGRNARQFQGDESPYNGLSSFQESDADRFFGRSAEIAALKNRIRDRPLIGIVGPSGTGKSSFVRAGLVPSLKRSGEAWETVVIRPGRNPMQSLASIVTPHVATTTSIEDSLREQREILERVTKEPGYVGSVLRTRARTEKKNILIFVDQFEELYTLVPELADRQAFTQCLSAIADDATSPIRVTLSIRSDFLDRVPEDARFMAELSQGLIFLQAPGKDGLRDAIVQPAEMAGYRYESEDIVRDMLTYLAGSQGALPLLQFAASKLWENRDQVNRTLTQEAYRSMGGVGGALASHADSVLAKMPSTDAGLVREIFVRLVTPDRTRAIVAMDELRELSRVDGEIQRLVDDLVAARLLVVNTGGGAATVEIVHESMIANWTTLRRWLEESGDDSVFLEQLRNGARAWQAKGRAKDLLWRGELADEAEKFKKRYHAELGEVNTAFLNAVVNEKYAVERRKRMLTVGGFSILVGLLFAAAIALVQIRSAQQVAQKNAVEAEEQKKLAEAEKKKALQALDDVKLKEQERAKAQAEAELKAAELAKKQEEVLAAFQEAKKARDEAEANAKLASEQKLVAESSLAKVQQANAATSAANATLAQTMKRLEVKLAEEQRRNAAMGGANAMEELK